jgi:hypothetical protein
MRAVLALALAAACTAAARADALPSRIDVRAARVAFYPYANAMLLAARGDVVVRAGARTIRADAVRIDVRAIRLVAAGRVAVASARGRFEAAAYALDLASGTGFALRTDGALPATYAVRDDDFATASEAPAAPDTFAVADLDGARPYIVSRHAIVGVDATLRMSPAEFPTAAGPSLALPTFVYTLVGDPNISQSTGPSSSFDYPYNLFGSPNSLTAAHVRYDAQNGVTFGLDERLLDGRRGYVVSSLLPLRDRRFDVLAFTQLRHGLQQTVSATRAFGAFGYTLASYRLQATSPELIQTVSASQFDATNALSYDLSTRSHDVGSLFTYQLHAGFGYDHALGGYPIANDTRRSVGGYAALPGYAVFGNAVNARYDYNLTAYDYPHVTSNGTLTLSGSRPLARGIRAYATASFAQIDDRYRDPIVAARALGLPVAAVPYFAPDGTPYPGYFAFDGLATQRTYSLQLTADGRGDDRVTLVLSHAHDFPQFHGFGRPPLFASLDVVKRITPTLRIELGRSYAFGWNKQYLSPQYTFAISP